MVAQNNIQTIIFDVMSANKELILQNQISVLNLIFIDMNFKTHWSAQISPQWSDNDLWFCDFFQEFLSSQHVDGLPDHDLTLNDISPYVRSLYECYWNHVT